MDNLLSFMFFVLLPIAIGLFGIYIIIDFFEYLKKNYPPKYKEMSFKSFFGIPTENAIFHLVKPVEFFRFLFSPDDLEDNNVMVYKKRIKLFVFFFLGLFGLYILYTMIF